MRWGDWQGAQFARRRQLVVTSGNRRHERASIHLAHSGEVQFSLEIRSQSLETLEALLPVVLVVSAGIEKSRGVKFDFGERVLSEPGLHRTRMGERLRRV